MRALSRGGGEPGSRMVLMAVALAISSVLAGGPFVSAPLARASAQTLRIGLGEDPDLLDPTLARSLSDPLLFAALCDKLVDIDRDLNLVRSSRPNGPGLMPARCWS